MHFSWSASLVLENPDQSQSTQTIPPHSPAQPQALGRPHVSRQTLKHMVGFLSTAHWTIRYPGLMRLLEQLRNARLAALCRLLMVETGGQVSTGPFATMKLTEELALSSPQFVLGSYEAELHKIINQVLLEAPAQVIDIGASYGYYAVGMALKIAATTVIAFEAVERPYWEQLAALARLNGVSEKIVQRGFCTVEAFAATCTPGAFVICDCEGGEAELLDPLLVPALHSCTMLVELHEFYRPHVAATLIQRFSPSHYIRIIEGAARNPDRYMALAKLPRRWRSIAVADVRWIERDRRKVVISARFMLLTPKQSHPAPAA